jgi:hypothetical protein
MTKSTELLSASSNQEKTQVTASKPSYMMPSFSGETEAIYFSHIKVGIDALSKPRYVVNEGGIFLVYKADDSCFVIKDNKVVFRDKENSREFEIPFTYGVDKNKQSWLYLELVNFPVLAAHRLVEKTHSIDNAIKQLQRYKLIDPESVKRINEYLNEPIDDVSTGRKKKKSSKTWDLDWRNPRFRNLSAFVGIASIAIGLLSGHIVNRDSAPSKVRQNENIPTLVTSQNPVVPQSISNTFESAREIEQRRLEQYITPVERAMLWNADVIASPYDEFGVTNPIPHDQFLGQDAYDIAAERGATIHSPINGYISDMWLDKNRTPWIKISNTRWDATMAHGNFSVKLGDIVTIGQPIGTESNQGYTTSMKTGVLEICEGDATPNCGNHTHINVFDKNLQKNINPLEIFADNPPPDYERLKIAKYQILMEYFPDEVTYWLDKIFQWSDQYGIDPAMLAIIMQIESCGFPEAVSRAQAQGLFQVMPFHFFDVGLRGPWNFSQQQINTMQDPNNNAAKGIAYFMRGYGHDYAKGNIVKAFAGYNGGHSVINKSEQSWTPETKKYADWVRRMWYELNRMAQGQALPNQTASEHWKSVGANTCAAAARWQQDQRNASASHSN